MTADFAKKEFTKIIIRGLRLDMLIGVHEHEKKKAQPVLINVEIDLTDPRPSWNDDLSQTLCYDLLSRKIKSLADSRHYNLVETFAEDLAQLCLTNNKADFVLVEIVKIEALPNAAGAGILIRRGHVG